MDGELRKNAVGLRNQSRVGIGFYILVWGLFIGILIPSFFFEALRNNVMGPVFVILLSIHVIIVLCRVLFKEEWPRFFYIFLLYWLLSLAILTVVHAFALNPYSLSFKDDYAYHRYGGFIVTSWASGFKLHHIDFFEGGTNLGQWFSLAAVYAALGRNVSYKILHCLYVTIQIMLAFDICSRLFGRKTGYAFILFAVLYTGFYVQSFSLLKEASVHILSIMMIYFLFRFELERRGRFIISAAVIGIIVFTFRFYMPGIILMIYLVYLVVRYLPTAKARMGFFAGLLVLIFISKSFLKISPLDLMKFDVVSISKMKEFREFVWYFSMNNLQFSLWNLTVLAFKNPLLVLKVVVTGMEYCLLTPFPWVYTILNPRWTSSIYTVWQPGMLVFHFLLPIALTAFWNERKKSREPAFLLWMVVLLFFFIFSVFFVGEPRRRDLFVMFFLIYGALGVVKYPIRWDFAICFWLMDVGVMAAFGGAARAAAYILMANIAFGVFLLLVLDIAGFVTRIKALHKRRKASAGVEFREHAFPKTSRFGKTRG